MAESKTLTVAVGTTNPTKLEAARVALTRAFPNYEKIEVLGASVSSGVSDQPMTDDETIEGAINRAKAALKAHPHALYGLGLEGGIQKTGTRYYEGCWVAVVDAAGKTGIGCSAKFELSNKFMEHILKGDELATVVDRLSGENDVRSRQGAMGVVTNGALTRTESLAHGVIFALAPFLSDARYWDE